MTPDPLLALGLIMLGMATGAMLTRFHYKRNFERILSELADMRTKPR